MKKKKYTAIFIDTAGSIAEIRMAHLTCSIIEIDAELQYIKRRASVELLFIFDGHLKNFGAEPSNPNG